MSNIINAGMITVYKSNRLVISGQYNTSTITYGHRASITTGHISRFVAKQGIPNLFRTLFGLLLFAQAEKKD